MIYLVTGEHPADLPETDLKIEFEEFCNLSPGLVYWLKQMTNPSLSSRFNSATEAIAELAACENYQGQENRKFVQPPNSKIILRQNNDFWEAIMPPKNFHWQKKMNVIQILLFCWLPCLIVIIALLMGIPLKAILEQSIQYLGIGAIATFAAVVLSYQFFKPLMTNKRLKIDSSAAILTEQVFGFNLDCIFARGKNTLEKLEINTVHNINNVFFSLNIYLAGDKFELVNNRDYPVTSQDIGWLAEELSIWLNLPVTKTGIDERTAQQVELYLKKAYELYTQDDYEQAIAFYDLVLQFDSQSYNAYLYRAISYLQLQNYQGVVEDCYLALELNSESAAAYCTRGAAFHYLEDYRSAKKDLNRAIDINPKYQQAYYYLAATNLAIENYHQAIENCDRAIEINHRYSYAYLMKGKAYLGLNNFQAAIENCDRALELNHNLLEGYFVRGAAHCHSGDHQTAMFNFYRRTILEPTASNYYNLAAIQFTQGMYSDALKSFNSCLKLDDRLKFAYYGRANIHFEFNNPELALQDFNTATDIEETTEDKSHLNDEHGYYVRGLAKYQIGENGTEALEDLEQAKEIAAKHQYKALEDKAITLINEINGNQR